MSLAPGTRLGPYEVTGRLGAGGMGEVFRARDTRLDRDVAIKVLPRHLSDDPDVRARFGREAKTISSLNHPRICTLFDVGREGDVDFLVMELVDGETLAQRLERGALPGPEVLLLGGQIADALDRAHRAGVVHRDLKPGNVMLTKSGAKLMDFGLARATGPATTGVSDATISTPAHAPTVDRPLTAAGTILGTFQYMAPEQLEGGEADARSDLWALGCVLYEMATGKRAFGGKSQASLIASILGSTPTPIAQLAPLSPPGLERLVQACIAKDPAERLQSAHDIKMQLQWLAEGGSQAGLPAPVAQRRRSRERLAWTLAGVSAAVAFATVVWDAQGDAAPEGPFFTAIGHTGSDSSRPYRPSIVDMHGPIALSPNGALLATVVRRGNGRTPLISVYDFADGSTDVLENTQGAEFPFWSPDSRWIGYFAGGKLRKVEARGGATQTLADAFDGRGGSWTRAGVIVFAPDIEGPLMQVSENGGAVAAASRLDAAGVTHRHPYFLPDGERFLFVERHSQSETVGRLMAGSLDGAEPRQVLDYASNVQLSAGHLLFAREGSLLAQRFDAETLTLSGPIEPVAESLDFSNGKNAGNFSATPEGLLVLRGATVLDGSLASYERTGRLVETLVANVAWGGTVLSRDLQQAAFIPAAAPGQGRDIWLLDIATRQSGRVTYTNTTSNIVCAFSPDGRRLAVSALGGGAGAAATSGLAKSALWIQPVSSAQNKQVVLEGEMFVVTDWSPDGNVLLGYSQRTGTSQDITYVRLDDPEPQLRDLVRTQFEERGPRFSPDGAWVAYCSWESGSTEVYVVDFPDATRKWRVSREGGSNPIWSRDGTELLFARVDTLFAVSVTPKADGLEIGVPTELDLPEALVTTAVGADGERILAVQTDPAAGVPLIQVIRNWPALLAR